MFIILLPELSSSMPRLPFITQNIKENCYVKFSEKKGNHLDDFHSNIQGYLKRQVFTSMGNVDLVILKLKIFFFFFFALVLLIIMTVSNIQERNYS